MAAEPTAPTAAALEAMIEDARTKKKQFDELITASNEAVQETTTSVTTAKTAALAEISQARLETATAKEGLDAAKANISAANAEIAALKTATIAEIETAKTSVTTAKAATEAIVTEIDKSKIAVATAKGAIEATQKSATADSASINQSKLAVDKLEVAATAQSASLTELNSSVSAQIGELQKRAASLEDLLTTLTTIKEEAATERAAVAADIATIAAAKSTFETLNTQTQAQYDALVTRNVTLDSQITAIGKADESIKQIYKTLFDDTDKVSVRTEVEQLRKRISEIMQETTIQRDASLALFNTFKEGTEKERKALFSQFSQDFSTLHSTLSAEIRALLPSAGAAGLSSTYYDAKSRYAPTSFGGKPGAGDRPSGRFAWMRSRFGYNPASVVATIFFYALFILPIVCIVLIFYDLLHHIPSEKLVALDLKIILLRVLIALPLAAISTFGFMSLRLYRRLYEEYNHKQRVMELYASFRKEIGENGTGEQKTKLLTIMLDAVADKSYLAATVGTAPVGGTNNSGEILTKVDALTALVGSIVKLKA